MIWRCCCNSVAGGLTILLLALLVALVVLLQLQLLLLWYWDLYDCNSMVGRLTINLLGLAFLGCLSSAVSSLSSWWSSWRSSSWSSLWSWCDVNAGEDHDDDNEHNGWQLHNIGFNKATIFISLISMNHLSTLLCTSKRSVSWSKMSPLPSGFNPLAEPKNAPASSIRVPKCHEYKKESHRLSQEPTQWGRWRNARSHLICDHMNCSNGCTHILSRLMIVMIDIGKTSTDHNIIWTL